MKRIIIFMLMIIPATLFGQTSERDSVLNYQNSVQIAITNFQNYYDISAEGTIYQKGTFPIKVDTTKIIVICSTLDKVTSPDGEEFTSPKVFQKIMYVCNKPNSFTLKDYFDEQMNPIDKNLIIWQTKEYPQK